MVVKTGIRPAVCESGVKYAFIIAVSENTAKVKIVYVCRAARGQGSVQNTYLYPQTLSWNGLSEVKHVRDQSAHYKSVCSRGLGCPLIVSRAAY